MLNAMCCMAVFVHFFVAQLCRPPQGQARVHGYLTEAEMRGVCWWRGAAACTLSATTSPQKGPRQRLKVSQQRLNFLLSLFRRGKEGGGPTAQLACSMSHHLPVSDWVNTSRTRSDKQLSPAGWGWLRVTRNRASLPLPGSVWHGPGPILPVHYAVHASSPRAFLATRHHQCGRRRHVLL